MKLRKKISLVIAMILSLSIFFANIAAIQVVLADEPEFEDGGWEDGGWDDGDDDDDDDDGGWEDDRAAAEAASREAERQAQEEREREEQRKLEEAYEKAAKEAEEAAKQAELDEAAKEAKRLAEEQEAKSKEAAEKKAAEDAAAKGYSLTANVKKIDFGTAVAGDYRDVEMLQVTNTGKTTVYLISQENDPDGAFKRAMVSDDPVLDPGETAKFEVSMSSSLGAGAYSGTLMFADSTTDPSYKKGISVKLTGKVTEESAVVKSVEVTPSKITLATGNDEMFFAEVRGTGDFDDDVLWSVQNNKSSKTRIDQDGILTIAENENSSQLTVIATSVANTSKKGYATVYTQKSGYNVSVSASPGEGGNVTGGGAVKAGGSVTVSAVPNKNYYFVGWIVNDKKVSTSTNYTINNVQSNMSVKAKFERNYVTVKVERNTDDGGTVAGGGKINYGDSTTISAKAYSGYVFTGWKEDGKIISRDASLKLKDLRDDRKITAIFDRTSHTLTLSARPAEGGTVSGGGTFAINQGTTVTAKPASGYSFVGWEVNGQIVNRDATVKIDRLEQDYSCTAVFIKTGVTTYEISAGVATTGGSISPSGKAAVAQGSNVTYKITPKSGYAILAVAVDNVQVGPVNSYTFSNVQGNHAIAAAFVLTDAGKAKAQAAGKQVQDKKVEKIEKTETNTAKTDSTVKLENAISGETGDEFVEEMEGLDEINVPSDEELGVEEEEEEETSDVAKLMGVSMEEARAMAAAGDNAPILDAAFYAGTLEASVSNTMEPITKQGIEYQNLSADELMMVSDDDINPSLPNLDVVVQRLLTTDEVVAIVDGSYGDVDVSLTKQDSVDSETEKIMKNAIGQKPLQYFDLTMIKSVAGDTQKVKTLPEAMTVIIEVPDEIYKANQKYSVLRVHDGELTVLPDLDDDPKTITFKTDRFSSYAIAKEVASSRDLVTWFALGATIALAIAITCLLILIAHQQRMRKMRRRQRAEMRRKEEQFDK